jgi:MFS family permease
MILPLALAQFIASYAATNMNVAISAIAKDLGTDVAGVQTAITLFTLTMAALMIPGSKLTDIWGASGASWWAWPSTGSAACWRCCRWDCRC